MLRIFKGSYFNQFNKIIKRLYDVYFVGEELLTPTKIYVKEVVTLIKSGKIKAFAHITGGGLLENIPRILPDNLGVHLDTKKWKMPAVFPWLAAAGGVNKFEMMRTFNCGIGGVLIIKNEDVSDVLSTLKTIDASLIGKIVVRTNNGK